jgi:hypothetical protein
MSIENEIKSHHTTAYILLLIIAVLSLVATLYFDLSETFKILTATPFVGSLLVALYQLIRDDEQFIRDSIIQDRQHAFNLAASSHMSEVVFDKHVEFAEAYMTAVREHVNKLTGLWGDKTSQHQIYKVIVLREKFNLWLSPDMVTKLSRFEKELLELERIILLGDRIEKKELETQEEEQKLRSDSLLKLINISKGMGTEGVITVLSELQDILGIGELTKMRDKILTGQKSE